MAYIRLSLRHLKIVWRYALLLAVAWSLAIVIGAAIHHRQIYRGTLEAVRIQAVQSFEKDLIYRRWAAAHGGVYVPVTDQTQPNPYLSDFENRDLEIAGMHLTLINPAYMTRQVIELAREQYGHEGHITSLDPLRPENVADSWETTALLSFENGITEMSGVESLDGREFFRLMRPLVTEESCLKCHAVQGYEVGDIRGGISISIPLEDHKRVAYDQAALSSILYVSIWAFGIGGICISSSSIGRQKEELARAAHVDPLTGLWNRLAVGEFLKKEIPRDKRHRHPIGVMIIDVNRFKEINDRFGHVMGDKVLQVVAEILQKNVRESDIVARWGGDEFLILLLETADTAQIITKRVNAEIADRNRKNPLLDFPVTLAVGTADWTPESNVDIDEAVHAADKHMYEDKRNSSA